MFSCDAFLQFYGCFHRHFRTKKRLAEGLKPNVPPDGGGLGGRSLLSSLTGPLVFTVGFGGVAISAAAVWQYENMRTRNDVQSFLMAFQQNNFKTITYLYLHES